MCGAEGAGGTRASEDRAGAGHMPPGATAGLGFPTFPLTDEETGPREGRHGDDVSAGRAAGPVHAVPPASGQDSTCPARPGPALPGQRSSEQPGVCPRPGEQEVPLELGVSSGPQARVHGTLAALWQPTLAARETPCRCQLCAPAGSRGRAQQALYSSQLLGRPPAGFPRFHREVPSSQHGRYQGQGPHGATGSRCTAGPVSGSVTAGTGTHNPLGGGAVGRPAGTRERGPRVTWGLQVTRLTAAPALLSGDPGDSRPEFPSSPVFSGTSLHTQGHEPREGPELCTSPGGAAGSRASAQSGRGSTAPESTTGPGHLGSQPQSLGLELWLQALGRPQLALPAQL